MLGKLRYAAMPDHVRLRMAMQQQQRRPISALDPENVDIARGDAKRRELLEGHGMPLVVVGAGIVGARWVGAGCARPRKHRTRALLRTGINRHESAVRI